MYQKRSPYERTPPLKRDSRGNLKNVRSNRHAFDCSAHDAYGQFVERDSMTAVEFGGAQGKLSERGTATDVPLRRFSSVVPPAPTSHPIPVSLAPARGAPNRNGMRVFLVRLVAAICRGFRDPFQYDILIVFRTRDSADEPDVHGSFNRSSDDLYCQLSSPSGFCVQSGAVP
jgi:hypothetical protein